MLKPELKEDERGGRRGLKKVSFEASKRDLVLKQNFLILKILDQLQDGKVGKKIPKAERVCVQEGVIQSISQHTIRGQDTSRQASQWSRSFFKRKRAKKKNELPTS